jgi:hypothetical protein
MCGMDSSWRPMCGAAVDFVAGERRCGRCVENSGICRGDHSTLGEDVENPVLLRSLSTSSVVVTDWSSKTQADYSWFGLVRTSSRASSTFLRKSGSRAISSSTFRIEWITVE